MELLEALRIIKNQKKVVIPLLIVAFITAGIMVASIETTYKTTGTVTLLNSNMDSTQNPYLRFDQSLQTTAGVLSDNVTSDNVRDTYKEKGLSSSYTAEVPYDPTRSTLLPKIDIEVTGKTASIASKTRDQILNDIKDELEERQSEAGAPQDSWIQAFSTANRQVTAGSGSRFRTFAIVFGLGAAFAIGIAFIIDGFARGVRNTRRGETISLETPSRPSPTSSHDDIAVNTGRTSATKSPRARSRKKSARSADTTLTH